MKKKLIILGAAAITAAAAVPALAFENEFHGMYKFMGFQSNSLNGVTTSFPMFKDSHSGFFAEQRARLQYIAKANDNLKLVTNFELDTRFGGKATGTAASSSAGDPAHTHTTSTGYLGTASGNDAGNLDADQLTLETKSVYLDFNCPLTGANYKVGIQPWADSYQSLFLLADMTGATATKAFGPATAQLGWFRFDDNTVDSHNGPGQEAADLFILDAKISPVKDIKVGASYYFVNNDTSPVAPAFEKLHTLGVNADMTFGPASIKPFGMYQFGEQSDATDQDISAFALGAVAKIKVGPGAINLSSIYLSGDENGTGDSDDFKVISAGATYFNPANMWLLVRSGQQVNSSGSVLGNDLSVGGRGLFAAFGGYEATIGKLFFNVNAGYGQTLEDRNGEENDLGYEFNAQVGYKLFDNLSASVAGAYMILGDGLGSSKASDLIMKSATAAYGAVKADDPYMANIQLSYTF